MRIRSLAPAGLAAAALVVAACGSSGSGTPAASSAPASHAAAAGTVLETAKVMSATVLTNSPAGHRRPGLAAAWGSAVGPAPGQQPADLG